MTTDRLAALKLLTEYPAQYGRMLGYELLTDDLHGAWMKAMITGNGDMTLQAHRGSYKTTAVSVALTAMVMLRGDINMIFVRKTDTDVREVIKQVARNIRHPATQTVYRMLMGKELQLLKATDTEITASSYLSPRGASQLLGMGIGGSITGKHADRIFTDDIVNLADRKSRAEREQTKLIYQELVNICNPGGRIINTGTPWHKDDAFSLMPEPMRFDCHSTGLLTEEQIEKLKASMSPSLFAANYELRHIAAENALFEGQPRYTEDMSLLRDGIAHMDAAYGGEDYTAFTCGKRRGDTIYLYGKLWAKHADTVLDAAIMDAKRLQCAPIHTEKNADKGYLAQEIGRRGYTARVYSEWENKYIKISTFLRKWWGNIVFLKGTDQAYIDQIMDYTEDAAHDDAPDSAACICRYYDGRG